jgi:hypothetical protein
MPKIGLGICDHGPYTHLHGCISFSRLELPLDSLPGVPPALKISQVVKLLRRLGVETTVSHRCNEVRARTRCVLDDNTRFSPGFTNVQSQ